ncbi:FHA domain-containing protein [Cohnella rhizosphaerae]|uniref:FHA domain-containing protein n=1 Tax=Cohnella rhizosphaerae TaxID=1457232 RepID=A0A9X4KT55_9BACL|nr:FHA domain-containing protein [Cohnella rhizosphaerae]MDG0809761.1 FHA domain-containing protein [Cohnella rhizosphaerae]
MKRRSGFRALSAAALALAAAAWPGLKAEAAPAAQTAAERLESQGMLPLLAAMAIGIAVSVIAVLAFLQMTSRGKSTKEDESRPANSDLFTSNQAAHGYDADTDKEESDEPGYTIPLRSLGDASDKTGRGTTATAGEGEPRLVGVAGQFAGVSYSLADRPLAIGRDSHQCELVYPDGHAEISRKHCTVSYDPSRRVFSLVDHGSSNGTYLPDGTRLAAGDRQELKAGDRFSLPGGEQWFEVDV